METTWKKYDVDRYFTENLCRCKIWRKYGSDMEILDFTRLTIWRIGTSKIQKYGRNMQISTQAFLEYKESKTGQLATVKSLMSYIVA